MKVIRKQCNADMCFVCGTDNAGGLHCNYYNMEDNSLIAIATLKEHHQSYPNRVHGGVSAALLDEALGRVIDTVEPDTWAVTTSLDIKYKKPVPYDETLYVHARLVKNTRLIFIAEGEIILGNGDIAATATGKYMKQPIDKITDMDLSYKSWQVFEDDIKEITLPVKKDFCR